MTITFSQPTKPTAIEAVLLANPGAHVRTPRVGDLAPVVVWFGAGAFRALRTDRFDADRFDAHLSVGSAIAHAE